MGQIDLQHDEIVIRRTTSVMVRSIPLEITLTTRRLILVDSRTEPPAQKNIPLASIREIKREEDTTGIPVITLSVMTESGTLRQMIISFPPLEGTVRTADCKEWFLSLEERTALTRATTYVSTVTPSKSPPETKPGVLPVEEPKSPQKARDWVPDFTPYLPNTKPEPVVEPPKKSRFIKIGAVILVILVIIFVIVAAGQFSKGKTATPQTSPTLVTVTTATTPLFTPTAVTTQILPTTAVSPAPIATPKYLIQNTNGIWMRIQYPGRYIGYVGSGGLNTEVNTTGEWLHQLPIASGMIEGTIEKQDGSTDDLIIEVYKDGALISSQNTRTPEGVLYIRTSV
jgi:hypothetical protein